MILLSSMSALFGEQISDVEYGAENISQVGGSTVGELVLLDTEDEYV
jgi:hypothetical protein